MSYKPLSPEQRSRCLWVGIGLVAILLASLATLIYFSFWYDSISALKAHLVLVFTALGGCFGGAVRALIMLISETGVHAKEQKSDDVDLYLSRWPLFIFKPFIGVGTGILFFLAVNYGLVQPLSSQPALSPLPVVFVAAVGGIFFEEAMAVFQNFVGSVSTKKGADEK